MICPPERRALREIVETAEVVREGDHLYLLARVSAATLDSLAIFETSREDLEEDDEPSIPSYGIAGEDELELDNSDFEPDDDREHDFPRERQKYILAAKKRKRVKA